MSVSQRNLSREDFLSPATSDDRNVGAHENTSLSSSASSGLHSSSRLESGVGRRLPYPRSSGPGEPRHPGLKVEGGSSENVGLLAKGNQLMEQPVLGEFFGEGHSPPRDGPAGRKPGESYAHPPSPPFLHLLPVPLLGQSQRRKEH